MHLFQGQTGINGLRGETGAPGLPVGILVPKLSSVFIHKTDQKSESLMIISGTSWDKRTTRTERT